MTLLTKAQPPTGEELELAIMRTAKGLSDWFLTNIPEDDPYRPELSYESFVRSLRDAHRRLNDEELWAESTEFQRQGSWQYTEMVRFCADGAQVKAAFTWVMMVPRLRGQFPEKAEWLIEALEPMTFEENELFIFGAMNREDAVRVMREYIPMLRWGISQMFPSQANNTIEVWDNNINVLTDEVPAA